MEIRLDQFDNQKGLNRGCSKGTEILWYIIKCWIFLSPLPWPTRMKCWILRRFGAEVGEGVNIKPRVNIHFPWKLKLGDWCWLGEEVFILNFEPVEIGAHACISQRTFLCCGNHNFRDAAFSYRNAPILIGRGAWIGAQVFVAPGVVVADHAVAMAGSVVTEDLPAAMICKGNPCLPVKPRWNDVSTAPNSPTYGQ